MSKKTQALSPQTPTAPQVQSLLLLQTLPHAVFRITLHQRTRAAVTKYHNQELNWGLKQGLRGWERPELQQQSVDSVGSF